MELVVRQLTPDLWPALEDLFATTGPVGRCWCMYWRIGNQYRRQDPDANKAAFRKIVDDGPPPGLLAFDDDVAVGWCQLTPREELRSLDRTWRLGRVDEVPVWSISCFYVRKGYRREGVARITAAVETARRAGAPAVEAYPLDGAIAEQHVDRVCHHVRARRFQDRRSTRAGTPDLALRVPAGRRW